nr:basic proline-rich protein-like [Vicugna pacos]
MERLSRVGTGRGRKPVARLPAAGLPAPPAAPRRPPDLRAAAAASGCRRPSPLGRRKRPQQGTRPRPCATAPAPHEPSPLPAPLPGVPALWTAGSPAPASFLSCVPPGALGPGGGGGAPTSRRARGPRHHPPSPDRLPLGAPPRPEPAPKGAGLSPGIPTVPVTFAGRARAFPAVLRW